MTPRKIVQFQVNEDGLFVLTGAGQLWHGTYLRTDRSDKIPVSSYNWDLIEGPGDD
jgi:hypothetical protein